MHKRLQHKRFAGRRISRRGAVLLIALICLLLVSMLGASLARIVVAQAKQFDMAHFRLQAEWLSDASAARAAAQLQLDPNYQGETWEPSVYSGPPKRGGVARIVVRGDDGNRSRRRVEIVCDFPGRGDLRARVENRLLIEL